MKPTERALYDIYGIPLNIRSIYEQVEIFVHCRCLKCNVGFIYETEVKGGAGELFTTDGLECPFCYTIQVEVIK